MTLTGCGEPPSMLVEMTAPPQSLAVLSAKVVLEMVGRVRTIDRAAVVAGRAAGCGLVVVEHVVGEGQGPSLPMAPPPMPLSVVVPWASVSPETVTADVPVTWKMRELSLPDRVSALAPGPVKVRSLSNAISPDVSVMVPVTSNVDRVARGSRP